MRNLQHRWTELTASHLFGSDGEGEEDPPDPQEGAEDDGDDGDDGKPVENKYSQEYVEGLRKEAAGHRVSGKKNADELEKVKAKLAEMQKAEMSDLEAAKADLDSTTTELEQAKQTAMQASSALKTERIQNAVTMAALEAGFEDPTDALSMISQDDLVDDEGIIQTKTVKARLKALTDKKPYLLKSNSPGSGDGGGRGKPGGKQTHQDKEDAYLKQFTETGGRVATG